MRVLTLIDLAIESNKLRARWLCIIFKFTNFPISSRMKNDYIFKVCLPSKGAWQTSPPNFVAHKSPPSVAPAKFRASLAEGHSNGESMHRLNLLLGREFLPRMSVTTSKSPSYAISPELRGFLSFTGAR
jgi:hypothetical protein